MHQDKGTPSASAAFYNRYVARAKGDPGKCRDTAWLTKAALLACTPDVS